MWPSVSAALRQLPLYIWSSKLSYQVGNAAKLVLPLRNDDVVVSAVLVCAYPGLAHQGGSVR